MPEKYEQTLAALRAKYPGAKVVSSAPRNFPYLGIGEKAGDPLKPYYRPPRGVPGASEEPEAPGVIIVPFSADGKRRLREKVAAAKKRVKARMKPVAEAE